jgi:hypothetical protein
MEMLFNSFNDAEATRIGDEEEISVEHLHTVKGFVVCVVLHVSTFLVIVRKTQHGMRVRRNLLKGRFVEKLWAGEKCLFSARN